MDCEIGNRRDSKKKKKTFLRVAEDMKGHNTLKEFFYVQFTKF